MDSRGRAADGTRMALIHAVEALEHAVLLRRRDADAGIRHAEDRRPFSSAVLTVTLPPLRLYLMALSQRL